MFKSVDRTTLENRMARYDRLDMWQAKAALAATPLMFLLAGVFDPGALGSIVRAAIELAVSH
jgi:tRNA G18 (ribose-2'-O)-methylase SpoU